MLVLSRKRGQSITVGDQIVITVVRISRGNVQIGIDAPENLPILRQEIVERMLERGEMEESDLLTCVRERIGAR